MPPDFSRFAIRPFSVSATAFDDCQFFSFFFYI